MGIKSDNVKVSKRAFQAVLVVKNLPASAGDKTRVQSLAREDPLEEGVAPHSVFLPREPHGQRSQVGYGPQGCTQLDMAEVT